MSKNGKALMNCRHGLSPEQELLARGIKKELSTYGGHKKEGHFNQIIAYWEIFFKESGDGDTECFYECVERNDPCLYSGFLRSHIELSTPIQEFLFREITALIELLFEDGSNNISEEDVLTYIHNSEPEFFLKLNKAEEFIKIDTQALISQSLYSFRERKN